MKRRTILTGTLGAVVAAKAYAKRACGDAPLCPIDNNQPSNCWELSARRRSRARSPRVALFVLGACEHALAEIDTLHMPLSSVAYLDDSIPGPSFGDYTAEYWKVDRKRIRKIDNAIEFAKRAIDANDRVVLIGNFSAPFASDMLVSLATMARDMNRPVVVIGGAPAPGAQGEIRTQRGWTCIDALQRIGCCVTTVPELDFVSNQVDHLDSVIESTPIGIDEGSPYCRALELALNEVAFSVASIDDDVLASTFGEGNFVSLGWGFSANGCDAAMATNMALAGGNRLSGRGDGDVTMQVLVTSNSDNVLTQLRTSAEMVSDAIGAATPIHFGASHSDRMTDKAVQVTAFRQPQRGSACDQRWGV